MRKRYSDRNDALRDEYKRRQDEGIIPGNSEPASRCSTCEYDDSQSQEGDFSNIPGRWCGFYLSDFIFGGTLIICYKVNSKNQSIIFSKLN